jgi:4-hydroxy-4-methyl-2-oxoglutarate aldolase
MNSRHPVAWGSDPVDAGITVPMLSDSCDRAGFRDQVFESRLQPLISPTRASGRARTVYYRPDPSTDPENPYDDVIEFIDGTAPGEIIVASTDSSNACAFWGELFSAAAKGRGANGVITDGNIRDSDKIVELQFPVFSRSARPSDVRGRMRVEASHVPVVIGGVTIHPGELVIADDDGIVVIPAEHEDTIVSYARERARAESTVLQELLAGATLREVWSKHGIL